MSSFNSSSESSGGFKAPMVSFRGGGGASVAVGSVVSSAGVSSENPSAQDKESSGPTEAKSLGRLLFAESAPFDVLMQRFSDLRNSDPDTAKDVFMQ
jgi:hypothetical protein